MPRCPLRMGKFDIAPRGGQDAAIINMPTDYSNGREIGPPAG